MDNDESLDRRVTALVPCIQPSNSDLFIPEYQHRTILQILAAGDMLDKIELRSLSSDLSISESDVSEDVSLSQSILRIMQLSWLTKPVDDYLKDWAIARYGLVQPKTKSGAPIYSLESTSVRDRFNKVTCVYNVMRRVPGENPTPIDVIAVSRDAVNYPSKMDFNFAFKVNRALYELGANVVEPICILEDIERDPALIKRELSSVDLAKHLETRHEQHKDLKVPDERLLLEHLVRKLGSCGPREIIFTRKLPHIRSDKQFAWFAMREAELSSQLKASDSSRDDKHNRLVRSQISILRGARDYAFSKHLESLVDITALGTFNPDTFVRRGIEVHTPDWEAFRKKFKQYGIDSDTFNLGDFLNYEFLKGIERLEKAAIAEKYSQVNLKAIHPKPTFGSYFQGYFNKIAKLIETQGLFGFCHGEAVLHHFGVDSMGIPRMYDFDKSKTKYFIFQDVISLVNNVIMDTNYEDRSEFFLKSVLHFAKRQLEYNVKYSSAGSFGCPAPADSSKSSTNPDSHDQSEPAETLPRQDIIKFNLPDNQALDALKSFSITDVNCHAADYTSVIESGQLEALLDLFDMLSASHCVSLAGRLAKLKYEDNLAYNDLALQIVDSNELRQRYDWLNEFRSVNREKVAQELGPVIDPESNITIDGIFEELNKPAEFQLGSFYDAQKTVELRAMRMYDSLNHLISRKSFELRTPTNREFLVRTDSVRSLAEQLASWKPDGSRNYRDSNRKLLKLRFRVPYFNSINSSADQKGAY